VGSGLEQKDHIMGRAVRSLTTAQYQGLLTGLPKCCPNTVFTIGGKSYTTPQVVGFITSILNVKSAVAPARAASVAATQAVETAEAEEGLVVKGVREVVALMFNNDPATLATLAISPRKPPTPLTTEQKAAAKAKAAATRQARGTKGPKQKAAITGNVTGVTITPLVSPPAVPATTPAAPATPAAAAGASGSSTPHA
jgi:hypothetical protein